MIYGAGLVILLGGAGAFAIAAAADRSPFASFGGVSGGSVIAVRMYGQGCAGCDGAPMSGRRWTAIPAANSDGTALSVGFKVPAGRRVYFRATLSADAWCNTGASGVPGEGACSVRVVVNGNGNSMLPLTSDFGHVMVSDQDSQYAPTSVEFYTPRSYPSGTYTITAQASFPFRGGMNLETDLLTVDEIAAP